MSQQTPVIVILGSTATGKTKLSLELAQRFNGEIVSADSMQVYKGLDISTAKATPEERAQAVHHMLDVYDLETSTFTVADYRDRALPIVDRILAENKVPIIVGGTTYYIESLLWKVLLDDKPLQAFESDATDLFRAEIRQAIDAPADNAIDVHDLLMLVDPITAVQIHPNNKRKVVRALEVYMNTGRTKSSLLSEQQSQDGGNQLGGPLRFDNVICFWLKCDQGKLDTRIDRRIEGMVAQGMLAELRSCFNGLKATAIDPTKGIAQAIGFKEFLPYLERYDDATFDADITEFRRTNQGTVTTTRVMDALTVLEQCLDELRLNTKRYSKKQLKWIQNRLIMCSDRAVPPIYELDGSHAEISWKADVFDKAEHIVQSHIDGVEPRYETIERREPTVKVDAHSAHFCEDCQRPFIGDIAYTVHMHSQRHKKVKKSRKAEMDSNWLVANPSPNTVLGMVVRVFSAIRSWLFNHL